MLKTIVAKDFLENLLTSRFSLGFFVCLLLVVANTYILMAVYEVSC